MAKLYISYGRSLGKDKQGNVVPVMELPTLGGQVITFGASTQSNPFPKGVGMVRLLADADAYIVVGTSPTATANSGLKLEADVAEYFTLSSQDVRAGTLKLAVYDGSS